MKIEIGGKHWDIEKSDLISFPVDFRGSLCEFSEMVSLSHPDRKDYDNDEQFHSEIHCAIVNQLDNDPGRNAPIIAVLCEGEGK